MLARSYHDLHECNSSQLVVIIITFIRNHLGPNLLWELCHFPTGASRTLLWLLRKANTGEIFHMLVTFRLTSVKQSSLKCVSSNRWTILKVHNHSGQVRVHSCTFAGRAFLHFLFFFHFCLCRTSRGWTHLAPTGSLTRRTFLQPSSDLLYLKWWKWKCQWSWLMNY